MPLFSKTSHRKLATCHDSLTSLFNTVVHKFDCTVLEGGRGAVQQMKYYHATPRRTKLPYPLSKHNPVLDADGIGEMANILGCGYSLEECTKAIINASEEQLIAIDESTEDYKSNAVDVIPYPVDWRFEGQAFCAAIKSITVDPCDELGEEEKKKIVGSLIDEYYSIGHNIQRWFMFIGYVKGIAAEMGIPLISGADWDGDNCMADQKFDDLPHFELVT